MAGRKPITEAQEPELLAALEQVPERDALIILASLHLGFRISETLSLNVSQVWEGGRVKAQVKVERRRLKGGRGRHRNRISSRCVPINPVLTVALEKYLFGRFGSGDAPPGEPLFPSRMRGRRLSRWRANAIVHQVLRAAGIDDGENYGTHSLRKAFCRKVYQATKYDINMTREIMAHASIGTTQKYLECDLAACQQAVLDIGRLPMPAAGAHHVGAPTQCSAPSVTSRTAVGKQPWS
jgi:integrase